MLTLEQYHIMKIAQSDPDMDLAMSLLVPAILKKVC